DLLTKAVWLNRGETDPKYLSLIGPVNLLLYLLRRGVSSIMSVQGGAKKCSIYIKDGRIVETSCPVEYVKEVFSLSNLRIDLFPYTGKSLPEKASLSTKEFFERLFSEDIAQKAVFLPKKADLSQPVELEKGLFWVGVQDSSFLFHFNVYLRIYEREGIKIPLLINTGTLEDHARVKAKIEKVLGSTNAIKVVILLDSGAHEYPTILSMFQSNPNLQIITSMNVAKWLNKFGVPMSRIRLVESLPDMKLRLSATIVLRIVPMYFLPYKGTFAIYEEETGFLFTSHLFSSLRTPEEFSLFEDPNIEDVVLYTSLSMPCSKAVYNTLEVLEGLRISKVFPAWGNPLSENAFRMALNSLKTVKVG
ncbi:MAG: hypothetical protein ACP5P0_06315, partial [Hydrogenobacter sp.]